MIEYQKNVLRGIEQYKEEILQLKDRIQEISRLGEEQAEFLINDNKQLREALRQCNEQELEISYECNSCGQGIIEREFCKFCGSEDFTHADDCEYVRLCGGAE